MIKGKLQKAINNQIQAEMFSAHLYLAMAGYLERENLKGFGNWMRIQYQEETAHAFKFIDYLISRGGTLELKAIEAPPAEFGTPVEVFQKVLAHEEHVTELINKLYELAMDEKDVATQIFLQWFVTEQIEEEASAGEILEKLKLIPEKSGALFYMDKELGKRVFTPPSSK